MSFDFNTAAANLGDYGLETVLWTPKRGEGNDKIEIGGGKARPLVRVADLPKFLDTFPNALEAVLGALDGSSIRVDNQDVIRRAVEKDRQVSDLDIVAAQLSRIAGKRASVKPSVESVLATASEDQIIAAYAARKGITLEEARELLA